MSGITRRNFIGATSAAAGLTFGGILSPEARGDIPKIRLGIIGTGARGQQHLREGLWGSKDFEIVAVADVYTPHRRRGKELAMLANASERLNAGEQPTKEQKLKFREGPFKEAFRTHREMLNLAALDAVLITTPPSSHVTIISDCLESGKHVFCETPMATSIADARDLVVKAHESGLVVQIGHQRRYHPNYNLVAKYFRDGLPLGRAIKTESYSHMNTHERRTLSKMQGLLPEDRELIETDLEHLVNWRLYAEPDGGAFLDCLPRTVDSTNWLCGNAPVRVFTSGGTDYWKDGRNTPDNLSVIFEYSMKSQSEQFVRMDSRYALQDVQAINKTYMLRGTFSYLLSNREHREHERLIGDRATASLSPNGDSTYFLETIAGMPFELRQDHLNVLHSGLKEKLAKWPEEERRQFWITRGDTYDPPGVFDGPRTKVPITAIGSEESAEVHQFRAFAEHIRNGGTPRANVMVGLAAVIAGESARRSYETGQPVDIDPALMEFDFETPSISMYDENAVPIPGTTELM